MEKNRKKVQRLLKGLVRSAKANKTVAVEVERIVQHPFYKKMIRRKRKYLAHDAKQQCQPGDWVVIQLVRPISKLKRWLVVEVLAKAVEKAEKEV